MRTFLDRLRDSAVWPLWLPAAVALVTGLVVFSPLFLELIVPYVVLVIVDLVLAGSASRPGGLDERRALVGITIATALVAVVVVVLAAEIVEAVVLLAALLPAWRARDNVQCPVDDLSSRRQRDPRAQLSRPLRGSYAPALAG